MKMKAVLVFFSRCFDQLTVKTVLKSTDSLGTKIAVGLLFFLYL